MKKVKESDEFPATAVNRFDLPCQSGEAESRSRFAEDPPAFAFASSASRAAEGKMKRIEREDILREFFRSYCSTEHFTIQ